ncbi:MAG: hypothetical protein K0S32_2292 [Bacteroidetes bacterium]|jgi:hypothetical protein|nr:hypothetical protein [Bacteroidota bacterium]
MNNEGKKRPPRTPLSPEEVAELVWLKKIREHKKIERFKNTNSYKLFNVFNVVCFFIYCELVFCFLGPCHYQTHYHTNVIVEYSNSHNHVPTISVIKVTDVNDKQYSFAINDMIEVPPKYAPFEVGKDFLLQKEIKGSVSSSEKQFRIQRASPILFLSVFVAIFSFIFFFYNLNQNPYSLRAITSINAITVFAFILI